jgi:hypothetical protein
MGKRFNPRDLLGIQSLPQRREDQTIVYRDPRELIPTQENFYNTRNIEKLKASIKITGYLMQPILIENVNEKDQVLAGHRRRLCCIDLINEGDTRFEKVPCMYASEIKIPGMETLSLEDKEKIEPILRQFKVIQTNNYRDKSDWEKMQEFLEMEKIVKQFKESMGLKGNLRDELKELMGISGGQYSRYKKISNNLIEELMKEFKEERIKISVADAVASLEPELQQQAYEIFMENGTLTPSDVEILKEQQDAEKGISGQMTIEQATGQQRPLENDTPIQPELQIERLFETLNTSERDKIIKCNKPMSMFLISGRYKDSRVRNGILNYIADAKGVMFNPDSTMEYALTWNGLVERLINRFGKGQKPVKMTTIDAPEKPAKKETNAGRCIHREGFTCTLAEAQKVAAGDGMDCNGKCCWNCEKHGTCGYECNASAHRPVELNKEEKDNLSSSEKCITGQSGSGFCGGAAYCDKEYTCCAQCPDHCNSYCGWISKKSCQPATETPDKKQQKEHYGETAEMAKHLKNTDKIPAAWPEELKDIPLPSTSDLSIYLQKQEDMLKRMTEVEKEEAGFPELVIKKQQMLVAGLRILKNLVEDCQEEPEQPGLPIMKNNDQRKEWLRNYKSWGLWYEDKNVGIKYYKYDFANGARLIVEEFAPDPSEKSQWYTPGEHHYMHLVGGPKPEYKKNDKGWSYHSRYNKYQNSETELVEFLKEIQK